MGIRAGIVVTGTEVLTARTTDRNGPWLSEQLQGIGLEVAWITVVGDRPEDLLAALEWQRDQGAGLICTTGGLGPTEDDLTAEVVSRFQQRPMALDEALEGRIWKILEPLMKRWPDLDPEAIRHSNRKQALVPDGATVLEPVGTAPGLVVPAPEGAPDGPPVLVLPGPPRELQAMWPAALETALMRQVLGDAIDYRWSMLRMFGIPESEIAETLRQARDSGIDIDSLEITTCLRRGEVEVVTRSVPGQDELHDAWIEFVKARHEDTLFSDDFKLIDEIVTDLLDERGWTIATAESCTAGLLAARLTEKSGSSRRVRGGVIVYANDVKSPLAGVEAALIEAPGAVSTEVAEALADGARVAV
ncbi:MAG TPA: nicotinamide-nucleotide amidohydrolase family protein, partial [Baekduia sp.]|nr:nicotinamide-nucleotide amidohydrolase family protein [Baekduia sp.]